jgi:hypothetical protein
MVEQEHQELEVLVVAVHRVLLVMEVLPADPQVDIC